MWNSILNNVRVENHFLSLRDIYRNIAILKDTRHFSVETIGYSAEGRSIELIRYCTGAPRTTLLWAFEDPTEPVGASTIFSLCNALAAQPTTLHDGNCNWALIPCINPDGVARNEGWFSAPGDPLQFLENAWEPAKGTSLFWDAPADCPEANALKSVIHKLQPDLLYNLHDESHFPGGEYCIYASTSLRRTELTAHLQFIRDLGMPIAEEPFAPPALMQDSHWAFSAAYEASANCLVFLDEACGYCPTGVPPIPANNLQAEMNEYRAVLEELRRHDPACVESADYHARSFLSGKAAKALCLAACALPLLRRYGYTRQADVFYSAFRDYIRTTAGPEIYRALPIESLVKAQLHLLLTLLHLKSSPAPSITP